MSEPTLSFDALAAIFDDHRALPPRALRALHRAFLDIPTGRVIEPGAGTGRIAIPALAAGHHVTAVDVSQPMLDVCASRIAAEPTLAARAALVVGDATALPFPDDVFDVGILAQVLYLIPDWTRAVAELVRVVRPGGRILLVQEPTEMLPALAARDAAWREAVEAVGYRHPPLVPDDGLVVFELTHYTMRVQRLDLARWRIGQTVGEADAGLDRLRPLYADLDDDAWDEALERFAAWREGNPMRPGANLRAEVTLALITATLPR